MSDYIPPFEILDHRLQLRPYPVTYISEECVRNPDGNLELNEHGQPTMRPVREEKMHKTGRIFFEVDTGEAIIESMQTSDIVHKFGQKAYRHASRKYKQHLKQLEAQEEAEQS